MSNQTPSLDALERLLTDYTAAVNRWLAADAALSACPETQVLTPHHIALADAAANADAAWDLAQDGLDNATREALPSLLAALRAETARAEKAEAALEVAVADRALAMRQSKAAHEHAEEVLAYGRKAEREAATYRRMAELAAGEIDALVSERDALKEALAASEARVEAMDRAYAETNAERIRLVRMGEGQCTVADCVNDASSGDEWCKAHVVSFSAPPPEAK